MSLPSKLREKYLKRLEELINEGKAVQANIETIPGATYGAIHRRPAPKGPDQRVVNFVKFTKWKTSCNILVSQVMTGKNAETVERFKVMSANESDLEWGLSTLEGIRENLESGFLDDLGLQVESAIAGDYMGQAERLLAEGQSGKFDHVPAAVLAGAVLEKALRTMCEKHDPPIPTVDKEEERLTLFPLINALKVAGVFNQTRATQLEGWARIRNNAAHGEFDQFTRDQVKQMISGINDFLATHLG